MHLVWNLLTPDDKVFFSLPCPHTRTTSHTQSIYAQTRLITLQPHWPLYTAPISSHSCHFSMVRTGGASRSELTADSSLSQTHTLLFTVAFHPTCHASPNSSKHTVSTFRATNSTGQCNTRSMSQFFRVIIFLIEDDFTPFSWFVFLHFLF